MMNNQIKQQANLINIQNISSVCDFSYVEATGSTNQDAMSAAKNNAPNLACFMAEKQTSGRGRRGRPWQTFPHKSIACSIIIRDGGSDMLPLLASLVLSNAILKYTGVKTDIKWPNDLLINNEKVAGILVESFVEDGKQVYILGIGLNVNIPTESSEIQFTTLEHAKGEAIDRSELLCTILQELKESLKLYSLKGWFAFKKDYKRKCITLGKEVVWHNGDKKIEGIAHSVTGNGTLCLLKDGNMYSVRSGDIIAQGSES